MRRTNGELDSRQSAMAGGSSGAVGAFAGAVGQLTSGVDRFLALDVDALSDAQVHQLLAANETAVKRLSANRAWLTHTLTSRAADRARAEQPGDAYAPERARRDTRRRIADEHRLSPSQAKQADNTGRHLAQRPRVAEAAGRGELSEEHLRVLNRTLDKLVLIDAGAREALEAELIEAAADLEPVTFGKLCRRRMIELDIAAAQRDLDRRHGMRSGRITDTPDGMTHLGVDVTGVDAEWLHTAIHAFRRPDATGEHRNPEARTADAVIDMARAALSTLDDPDARGARPIFHFVVSGMSPEALEDWRVGEALHTGPLPRSELERLLGDCHLAAILGDAKRLPVAVTEQVRTVPSGLWRLLVVRDGGCIWDGCDAPPAWCDMMHLGVDYAAKGKLSPGSAGLGCRRHHRKIDRTRRRQLARRPTRRTWAVNDSPARPPTGQAT